MKVIGSCKLFAVHSDTQCLKELMFHVMNHEGSVVLSCVTTLELSLIQPHHNLDFIPSSANLISSNANHLRKKKFQKNIPVSKPGQKNGQARNNLRQCQPQMDIMLISVLKKKIKIKQASGSVKPMLFLV